MQSDLETKVWCLVQETCDTETFTSLVQRAFDTFNRTPGYDPVVRIYGSDVGLQGLLILRDSSLRNGTRLKYCSEAPPYIEVRSRLKAHLRCQLQSYLLQVGRATDEMKEDQLDRDLGL